MGTRLSVDHRYELIYFYSVAIVLYCIDLFIFPAVLVV